MALSSPRVLAALPTKIVHRLQERRGGHGERASLRKRELKCSPANPSQQSRMSDIRVELIRDLGPARQHGRTRYAPRHSPGRQRGTDGVRRPPAHTRGCRTPTRREGTERARRGHGAGTERARSGHTAARTPPSPTAAPCPVCAAGKRLRHAGTTRPRQGCGSRALG